MLSLPVINTKLITRTALFWGLTQRRVELKITPILDKLLEYKRRWIQHVNRMPRNRLSRVMKYYSPTGRRNHGRPLKRLLDTWDRNGSTTAQLHDRYMMMIFNNEKLHVSASSGHHQVFTLETIKIALYNSRDGVLMNKWGSPGRDPHFF